MLLRFAVVARVWQQPLGRALLVSIGTYCIGSLFLHGSLLRFLYILMGLLLAYGASLMLERRRAAA